jgi:hypothetical protein
MNHIEYLGIDDRIILKLIEIGREGMDWIHLTQHRDSDGLL